MDAQVAALESYVKELRLALNDPSRALSVARDAAALQLCLMLYRLIVEPAH